MKRRGSIPSYFPGCGINNFVGEDEKLLEDNADDSNDIQDDEPLAIRSWSSSGDEVSYSDFENPKLDWRIRNEGTKGKLQFSNSLGNVILGRRESKVRHTQRRRSLTLPLPRTLKERKSSDKVIEVRVNVCFN